MNESNKMNEKEGEWEFSLGKSAAEWMTLKSCIYTKFKVATKRKSLATEDTFIKVFIARSNSATEKSK